MVVAIPLVGEERQPLNQILIHINRIGSCWHDPSTPSKEKGWGKVMVSRVRSHRSHTPVVSRSALAT
jgi:hypothetical protein